MIKKSLTIIAGGLLVVNVASATELYNQDGTTFSVGGYMKMGYQSDAKDAKGNMDKVNGKYNNSRINLSGTREINPDFKGFAKVEWRVNPFATSEDPVLQNRLGYIGFDHKDLGTITFGKQWSTYYNVASFTDLYDITGNDAIGIYGNGTDDNDGDGSFVGTGRANSALKYDKAFGSTGLSLQYQANDTSNRDVNGNLPSMHGDVERKYSFSGSVVQGIGEHFKLGIAGHYAKLDSLATDVKMDRTAAVAGATYKNDWVETALTVSYNTNLYAAGISESTSIGQESYLGVKVAKPTLIYVGNNYSKTSYDLADMKDTTDVNYLAIGAKYDFTSDFALSGEYRYDLRTDDQVLAAYSNSGSSMNKFALAVKYTF